MLITGCHPGECHYIEQNYKALRRYLLLQRDAGADGHRAGAREAGLGQRRRRAQLGRMRSPSWSRKCARLGPLNWGKR